MADLNARDAKLVQYLNEAYGKEKQLETALQAHIQMADARKPYKKRLQQHLKETKSHGREVSRRIKALGGKADTASVPGPEAVGNVAQAAQNIANRAAAAAQGPLHAVRGTGVQEVLLKNAKTEYQDEAEEIATYSAIEALANAVGDKETAKLAKSIIRDEERMRDFLGRLIPQLSKAVATSEVPAALRSTGRRRSSSSARRSSSSSSRSRSGGRKPAARSRARKTSASRSTGRKTSTSRSTGRKTSTSRSTGRKTSASRSSGRKTSSARSGARKTSSSRSGGRKTTASRSGARKTTASRSGARKTASRSSGRSTSSSRRSTSRASGRSSSGGRSTSRRSSGSRRRS